MTTIIKGDAWDYCGHVTRKKIVEVEPLFYMNRELEYIDYCETTANSNWVTIKFKDDEKVWIENGTRFEPKSSKEIEII